MPVLLRMVTAMALSAGGLGTLRGENALGGEVSFSIVSEAEGEDRPLPPAPATAARVMVAVARRRAVARVGAAEPVQLSERAATATATASSAGCSASGGGAGMRVRMRLLRVLLLAQTLRRCDDELQVGGEGCGSSSAAIVARVSRSRLVVGGADIGCRCRCRRRCSRSCNRGEESRSGATSSGTAEEESEPFADQAAEDLAAMASATTSSRGSTWWPTPIRRTGAPASGPVRQPPALRRGSPQRPPSSCSRPRKSGCGSRSSSVRPPLIDRGV